MTENQGVCNWAVRLEGSDDPPVVVEVDSPRRDQWQPYAPRFSTYTYTQVWDHMCNWNLAAQERALAQTDLAHLRTLFVEGPRTTGWPPGRQYRFAHGDQRMLIWDDKDAQADWWLWAPDEAALLALARQIWHCGNLATGLYSLDEPGQAVLRRLRG